MEKKNIKALSVVVLITLALLGCAGSQKSADVPKPNEELALKHFLEGSVLDQKSDYAKAILEYQDALHYKQDAAIYYALAKDYSLLGKHELAIQMCREAISRSPKTRIYRETMAEIYLNALDLENAIKEYQQVVELDSQYYNGWMNLARLHQLRELPKALKIYEEVIDRFGSNPEAYYQMAQIYHSMGKLDKATDVLKEMLELDLGNFEIKKTLGDTYMQRDSVESALGIYNELVELNPENFELRASMAHAYLLKQDYDNAANQFDIVMKKDSLSADDQVRFGQIFVSFIEKDSAVTPHAIKLFERIQKTNPNDWRPYWYLGAFYNILQNDSEALTNFQRVKELASWNPDGWIGIASIYYDSGRFDDAITVLTEAKKFVPEEFRVHFLMGVAYQRKHQPLDAASCLEKAIQINEKNVDAKSALALVYDELKRYEESDTLYESILHIAPHNHLVLNNYGYSLAERGIQLERALRMAKAAVDLQPNNQSYLDTYGWVFYRIGQYEEAEKYIRKAIDLGSKSAVIHDHLGDVYFQLNDKGKAMEYWDRASQLDPMNAKLKEKIQRGSL